MTQELLQNEFLSTPITRRGLFSPAECERILAEKTSEGHRAMVQRTDLTPGIDETVRKATSFRIEPLPEHYWIWERIGPSFFDINQRFFHFHLAQISPLAVMEYAASDFYDSHVDIGLGKYSLRKLSCVIFLSPEDSYSGGRLLFGVEQKAVTREQGAGVFFPAYMLHQVEPIAAGTRRTLVCWGLGNAFS